jgi:L-lactate dehydrogenase
MKYAQKCAVIGCGNVGATTAYSLMLSGLFNEIVLLDIDKKRAQGEAEDIAHGIPFNSPVEIYAGDYSDIYDAGILIITAGVSQRPGETRIDLIQRNTKVFSSIINQIKATRFDGIILVVTNPVDILTYVTIALSKFDPRKVLGSGTVLDTARLKQLMGNKFGVDARNIHTFIIGEHGDSELPVWSSANVSGIDIDSYCLNFECDYSGSAFQSTFESVRDAAYSIIEAKGATYYAIAEAVKRIVTAIVRDERTILPVSTLLSGQYGISDVCLGIPCVVGKNGIEEILEIPLNETEKKNIIRSANALQNAIATIGMRATI